MHMRTIGSVVALLGALASCHGRPAEEPRVKRTTTVERTTEESRGSPAIDPKADGLVRNMSDYLRGLKGFTFEAEHTTEVVLDSGQKVQFEGRSDVAMRRPNKIRSDRRGEVVDAAFYYDGDTVTIYGKRLNLYAQAPAPGTIDETIDQVRNRYDIQAPAADFLYANPYEVLMDGAVSSKYVDEATVDGAPCDHVMISRGDVDLQLWIEQGERPLPRKYVITTKDEPSQPEFTVRLHDWDTAAVLPDVVFTFAPPAGAERVAFLGELGRAVRRTATERVK